jgi:hypothetical protein
MGWASYRGHTAVLDLLSPYSRDIWNLCHGGYVDRVRAVLAENPPLARAAAEDGTTPLWWLPDDEAKAMQIVDLLVAAGADTAAKNKEGQTAADMARRRAMTAVAARLER